MQSYCNILKKKTGQAMFAAIFVMIIIGILAIRFHLMSRDAQANAHRFQASEVAQQLAESAIDEAFEYVFSQTGKPGSDWFNIIRDKNATIDCSTGSLANKDGKGKDIAVPLTVSVASNMGLGSKFDINVKGRIIDFRDKGPYNNRYYGKEGVGTLELKVKVTPKPKYTNFLKSSCIITRHHDYKVVCIVSNKSKRNSYVSNFILDYAFLICDGAREFHDTLGYNLNPRKQHLKIDTLGKGKVYIGGSRDNPVFLDIDESRKTYLPAPQKVIGLKTVNHAECLKIMPYFFAKLEDEVRKAVRPKCDKIAWVKISGFQGTFNFSRYPICDDALGKAGVDPELMKFRKIAWSEEQLCPGATQKYEPGITIEPKSSYDSVLQGKIRKRYFHFGYFLLDSSSALIQVRAGKKKYGKMHWKTVSVPLSKMQIVNTIKGRKMPCFHEGLVNQQKNTGQVGGHSYPVFDFGVVNKTYAKTNSLISAVLEDGLPYAEGTKASDYPPPTFYNFKNPGTVSEGSSGIDGFLPFAHVSLWARRNLSQQMAENYLIYDKPKHTLNLRGIVYINKPLVLGKDGQDITVKGQGVIIANGITIDSGIKADGKNICVLCTRGYPITVNTDRNIKASLIAIGRNSSSDGTVIATKKLSVEGAFAVGRLNIQNWKQGVDHVIKYDSRLSRTDDLYQINLSRWVSFERMVEKE